ncbi:hypothetical protein EW146_g10487, partial [Bondarzewia mesenterica]
DFHLAKRHYDLALEANSEAYLPVTLSLAKLYARSIWHTITGGKDGLSLWEYEDVGYTSEHETENVRELDSSQNSDEGNHQNGAEDELGDGHHDDDGSWYFGRARDEYNRRRRGQDVPGDDDDPVQWARDRRNAESELDSDLGPEDYFEGALRGGHRGEEDVDEFSETMIELRREERQRNGDQAPQEGEGLFPPPEDPARDDWAVLRATEPPHSSSVFSFLPLMWSIFVKLSEGEPLPDFAAVYPSPTLTTSLRSVTLICMPAPPSTTQTRHMSFRITRRSCGMTVVVLSFRSLRIEFYIWGLTFVRPVGILFRGRVDPAKQRTQIYDGFLAADDDTDRDIEACVHIYVPPGDANPRDGTYFVCARVGISAVETVDTAVAYTQDRFHLHYREKPVRRQRPRSQRAR